MPALPWKPLPGREGQQALPAPRYLAPLQPRADPSYQEAGEQRPGSPGSGAGRGQQRQRPLDPRAHPYPGWQAEHPSQLRARSSHREGSFWLASSKAIELRHRKGMHGRHRGHRRSNPPLLAFQRRETPRPAQAARAAAASAALPTLRFSLPRLELQLAGWEGYGSAPESWLLWAHTDLQVNEVGGSKERRTLLARPSACPHPPPPLDRMTPCVWSPEQFAPWTLRQPRLSFLFLSPSSSSSFFFFAGGGRGDGLRHTQNLCDSACSLLYTMGRQAPCAHSSKSLLSYFTEREWAITVPRDTVPPPLSAGQLRVTARRTCTHLTSPVSREKGTDGFSWQHTQAPPRRKRT